MRSSTSYQKLLGRLVLLSGMLLLIPAVGLAGPPYTTDDPEPVEYQHWEFYLASQLSKDTDGWSGTCPHFEMNYGAYKNLQLHVIAPLSFVQPTEASSHMGYGDTELGAKYRFIEEGKWRPQIGIFPIVEVPTGNKGLGNGHTQVFLPIWLQKSFGKWTSYGGGGYWINPGTGNKNFSFVGWQIQRKLNERLSVGTEIYHTSAKEIEGKSETRFNVGMVYDFNERHHLLFSAGRGITGENKAQFYIGYQLTIGPHSNKE